MINQAFEISSGRAPPPPPAGSELGGESPSKKPMLGCYLAKYLGSVPVTSPSGNEIVVDAVKRVKQLQQAPRNVSIVVSAATLDIVEHMSGELIKSVPILDVSFTALDPKDKKLFSYITHDARLKLMACHVFSVKGKAQEIPITIAEAFRAVSAPLKEKRREQQTSQLKRAGSGAALEKALSQLHEVGSTRQASGAIGVFEAKFIGSITVHALKGNDVVEAAVHQALMLKQPEEGVVIIITADGIRTIEGLTGEILNSVFISNVSFTTVVGPQSNIFAYISNEERLHRKTCHLYKCGPHKALEVAKCIGEAFKVAHDESIAREVCNQKEIMEKKKKKKERSKKKLQATCLFPLAMKSAKQSLQFFSFFGFCHPQGNPFAPESAEREAIHGELFTCQVGQPFAFLLGSSDACPPPPPPALAPSSTSVR